MTPSALLSFLIALQSPTVADAATPADPVPPDEYRIHIRALPSRQLEVDGAITVRDSTLMMRHSVWSSHLPDRWATWIPSRIVRYRLAQDDAWRRLDYLGDARWDTSRLVGRRIRIRYAIRLEHDRAEWPYGLKESTYVTDDMLHAVGMSLFVYAPSVQAFTVRFDVPAGWRVLAPWDRITEDGRAYEGVGAWQLVHSVLALGSMAVHRAALGDAEVLMALSGDVANDSVAAAALLEDVAAEAWSAFGSPPTGRLTIIIRRGDASGGGAFYRGFSMLTRSRLDPDETAWKRTLAHELIHMWIGTNGIQTAGAEEEWFKEGFTAYYTALLLARANAIDRSEFLAELYRLWKMHRREIGPPLDEAGSAERRWYDHLYGGGAVVAACLDVRLREGRRDGKGLDDLMSLLLEHSSDGGPPLSNAALVDAAGRLGGDSVAAWVGESIRHPDNVPVADCLRWLGLEERGFLWTRRLVLIGSSGPDRYERMSRPRRDRAGC